MRTFRRLAVIVGAIPVVLVLAQRGVLSIELAAGLLMAIVIGVAAVDYFMAFALPIFALALFITYNATTNQELKTLTGLLLVLALVLFGLYVMVRGVSRGGRRKE